WLGGLLAAFAFVDLFLLVAELVTVYWSGVPDAQAPFEALVTGRYWWAFWGQVVLEVGALALMLSPRRRARTAVVGVAATMGLVGILFKRLGLVLAGFVYPLVDAAPGVSTGEVTSTTPTGIPLADVFATEGNYVPTGAEYVIIAGLLALGLLAVTLAARHLPLRKERV
ncbi:MAG TPA: NrfD/PsrC family molybdoenzyme membrane anchor subunit, partial [Acidimicrobiales bacterium]|nr:NrfD/PsrC family molybdoenzyme membrane anchor subunit [Acidimicrobiales bacterium]